MQFAKNTLPSYQKQLKQRDMKAKRTMITVLPTREDLSKEEKEHLNACKIHQSVYLTDKTMEQTKSFLYGGGRNSFEFIVSRMDEQCYQSMVREGFVI